MHTQQRAVSDRVLIHSVVERNVKTKDDAADQQREASAIQDA